MFHIRVLKGVVDDLDHKPPRVAIDVCDELTPRIAFRWLDVPFGDAGPYHVARDFWVPSGPKPIDEMLRSAILRWFSWERIKGVVR